jgi:hypothetical protein
MPDERKHDWKPIDLYKNVNGDGDVSEFGSWCRRCGAIRTGEKEFLTPDPELPLGATLSWDKEPGCSA